MSATHKVELLNLPVIQVEYKTAQICPDNTNMSLIYLGKLCNAGCEAVINSQVYNVYQIKTPILTAHRCKTTGMYVIDIYNLLETIKQYFQITSYANGTLDQQQAKIVNTNIFIYLKRTKFLHADLGGLKLRTLKQSVSTGYLKS